MGPGFAIILKIVSFGKTRMPRASQLASAHDPALFIAFYALADAVHEMTAPGPVWRHVVAG